MRRITIETQRRLMANGWQLPTSTVRPSIDDNRSNNKQFESLPQRPPQRKPHKQQGSSVTTPRGPDRRYATRSVLRQVHDPAKVPSSEQWDNISELYDWLLARRRRRRQGAGGRNRRYHGDVLLDSPSTKRSGRMHTLDIPRCTPADPFNSRRAGNPRPVVPLRSAAALPASASSFFHGRRPQPRTKASNQSMWATLLPITQVLFVDAFRGVPYALPPTGDRRFRQASKVEANPSAIVDASQYGPSAPGKPLLAGGPKLVYSEDCLTANIFRPSDTDKAEHLPVSVYIHGGAFNRGTASMHNTASMVAFADPPHVAVSFNYRLGALGFLPSTITANEGVLNLGHQDQLLLLQWVQENIAAFGGDVNRVTLVGLSAGAHSIGHLLMYYKEGQPPLFHRVIIESGASTSRAVRPFNAEVYEAQFRDLLREVECPESSNDIDILQFLQSVPHDKICAAQTAVFDKYNPSLRWAFQPVIDGDIIPRPPLETGSWGSGTRNEGSLDVNKQLSTSAGFTDFFSQLIPLFDESDLETLYKLYPDPLRDPASPLKETREGVGAQYNRVEAAYANYAYQAPVRQTAEFASAASVPVYLYQWALETSILEGAQHGDNMRYETCDPSVMSISETQAELARTLNAYISSFIAQGEPNDTKAADLAAPLWEPYTKAEPRALVFGLRNKELVGGKPGVAAEMMDDTWARVESEFWWSKVPKSQQ
ncbi:Phenmedipham hydrolase [Paramyrothecium foliicola]|nr:Phenmedipham hydrolase [Paramyrothecium foliicola]